MLSGLLEERLLSHDLKYHVGKPVLVAKLAKPAKEGSWQIQLVLR